MGVCAKSSHVTGEGIYHNLLCHITAARLLVRQNWGGAVDTNLCFKRKCLNAGQGRQESERQVASLQHNL